MNVKFYLNVWYETKLYFQLMFFGMAKILQNIHDAAITNVTKYVKHWCFINFNTKCYITLISDVSC